MVYHINIYNSTILSGLFQIHVESTDYDRTLMSAYTVLSGLYPPSGDQIWNTHINWQPIPVHISTTDQVTEGTHIHTCWNSHYGQG